MRIALNFVTRGASQIMGRPTTARVYAYVLNRQTARILNIDTPSITSCACTMIYTSEYFSLISHCIDYARFHGNNV